MARERFIAYGGSRGGGKSFAVRMKAALAALHYGGIRILILRRSYPELYENHIKRLRALLQGAAVWRETDKSLSLKNGSLIKFGYLDSESDADRYQGQEYDLIFMDEATHFTEYQFRCLSACLRGTNSFPHRMYLTCNPGGVGHSWVKRLFIDRKYEPGENPADYSFIQSLVTDNRALMESQPDYVDQLKALPPKLRDAWLHGRWDVYEGQFFEELRLSPDPELCAKAGITVEQALEQRRFTHVIAPLDMNTGERRGWKILRSYDFGYRRPFSLGYWAVDYDGVLYRILELYGCTGTPDEGVKWTPEEQFRRIARLEREHPWLKSRKIADGVADPAIWDSSRGESIADTAARYGIYFSPGDNHRIPGWMQVHYRLQFDENGYPRMYVFEGCKAFLRTMPLMMYDPARPEDLDTTLEDHCPDEVRYLCMSQPVAPLRRQGKQKLVFDPLEQGGTN